MPLDPITPLPTLPTPPNSISRPGTFNADSDATFGALPGVVAAFNANVPVFNANVVAAGEGAVATAADRIQTGLDRTAAAGSATTATTKAGEAVISAAAAEASRIAASKLNLGNKASQPTLDNQGAALLAGATYYDTTLSKWRVWTGAGWGEGISAVAGVSSVNGLTGPVTLKTVNGTAITGAGDIPIPLLAEVPAPTNTSPANAATAVGETPVLTGSAFASLYSATHANSQVQVHTSNTFTSPLYDSGSVAGSVSVTVPAATLAVSSTYYWRMRYKNSRGTWSEWSTATSFATAAAFGSYIATPAATPAAFGDAFEGGFYTGMIWNELVQTATSTTIGTGSKVFTVPSMTGAPIVYAGQTLEVRSRANPANKMIGTVTGASGTSLTINVASVGGSGTLSDWSVMARYRVIVAPKASGENTAIAYKNANTAAPSACGTLSEGRKATLAMVAADTAAVYPAAHWCNNLTIAGKTDWHLPARDELELCWRNLKPTADANYVTADRPAAATPNYMNLGSYGDTANTHGLSDNTSPAGSAHISGAPAQVAAGKNFRTGEAEAFAYGSFYYWSASEYSASYAWYQYWYSSNPGYQSLNNKTSAYYVRAVRRSII